MIKVGSWLFFQIENTISNVLITGETLPSIRSAQRTLLI